jgi:hypothetical protein
LKASTLNGVKQVGEFVVSKELDSLLDEGLQVQTIRAEDFAFDLALTFPAEGACPRRLYLL